MKLKLSKQVVINDYNYFIYPTKIKHYKIAEKHPGKAFTNKSLIKNVSSFLINQSVNLFCRMYSTDLTIIMFSIIP